MPIQLLIYATQTAVTTLTCIADYMAWPDYANSEKVELSKLYVPYLAVGMWKRERKEKKKNETLPSLLPWLQGRGGGRGQFVE